MREERSKKKAKKKKSDEKPIWTSQHFLLTQVIR